MTDLKKFVIISKERPKFKKSKKHMLMTEITEQVENHKIELSGSTQSLESIRSTAGVELLENILALEKLSIEIINNATSIDCTCCLNIKKCFSGNNI